MKIFGLSKQDIDLLKSVIEKYLSQYEKTKVYLFGSRATGKFKAFSDIDIAIKLKIPNLNSVLFKIQEELEDSDLPFKVDVVNWAEIAPEYLPGIKKDKILFWTPAEVERKSAWRICPIGEYWTKTHLYKTQTGKLATQSGHCKKNPSGKDVLKSEEINIIPTLDIFKLQKKMLSANDLGFKNGNKYDDLIVGWVAYWNDVFKVETPLEPKFVKVLMATESSFRANLVTPNKNKKIGSALGVTQITESTLKILKNKKGELKDHFVEISLEDAQDPNMNIAASVRWLFRKYETAKKRMKRSPTWEEVLWEYKGITKDNSKQAMEIKQKIKEYLFKINSPSLHQSSNKIRQI